ncbi:MAG TPA: hypothetical protein VFJ47_03130, partial [Terriglobales bacterium]|nr:hypothetical protein [Terriglobales bacterium]
MARPADSLTLGLLPEQKLNRRAIAAAYSAVALAILLLINLGLIFPQRLQRVQYHISSWIPVDLKPYKQQAARKQTVAHKLPPAPVPVTVAKLTVPHEIRVHEQPKAEIAPPKIETNAQFMPAVVKTSGARPDLVVHTGEFGSSATATVNAPIQKVQTGGFGDPNGVPGQGKANAKLQIASAGSFDLPNGPGKGNGTGGARGIAGNIASAGFGNGIASPGRGDGRSPGVGSVQSAGFAAQAAGPGVPKPQRQLDSGPASNPVEITYKPNPVY